MSQTTELSVQGIAYPEGKVLSLFGQVRGSLVTLGENASTFEQPLKESKGGKGEDGGSGQWTVRGNVVMSFWGLCSLRTRCWD